MAKSLAVFVLSLVVSISPELRAQKPSSNEPADLFDKSIEELMDIQIVTGASRLPQMAGALSSPVTILTAEDIHRTGLTSIPDILRFACGTDVVQIERRRYATGIHGLHETFSDRTALLINGRPADNPVYGGPDWQGLSVLIDDIERIEIVRSPGSASWGTNALTGVINIVTKRPSEVIGGMAKSTVTEFGDSYTQLRWAQKQRNWSMRVSAGYEDVKSSQEALDDGARYRSFIPAMNSLIGFDSYQARDFARNGRIDSEAFYDLSDSTELSLGLGYTHITAGPCEMGGYFPDDNVREDHVRSYSKLDHTFEGGDSAFLQWSGKYWNTNWPMATQLSTQQHELETQYNFSPKDDHLTSVGTSFRWDHIDSDPPAAEPQEARLKGVPLDEYDIGLFAIDRWEMTERWTLETQARVDWYSPTQMDWSGRLTALRALDPAKQHTLRFSAVKAFSAPLAELRNASRVQIPIGGGLYLFRVNVPRDLENEETFCLEAGYKAVLSKTISLRVDTFYQQFDKLLGYRRTTDVYSQTIATADNLDGAESCGGEVELAVEGEWGRVSTWYSYDQFTPDESDQSIGAFLPAKHKAGARYYYYLWRDWTFAANYAYLDTTPGDPFTSNSIGASNRLDLTLSKTFNKSSGEIMIGVSDLFEESHDAVRESIEFTGHETPGRTFFLSLCLKT